MRIFVMSGNNVTDLGSHDRIDQSVLETALELAMQDETPLIHGYTEAEWGMALEIFEEQLSETPLDKREVVILNKWERTFTPNSILEEVRNKTEVGAFFLTGLVAMAARDMGLIG
jgi:hypothetical protein